MTRFGPALTTSAAILLLVAACSSSSGGNRADTGPGGLHTPTGDGAHSPVSTAPTTATHPAPRKKSAGALSGTWNGKYGGAYDGTFTLRWRQSGTSLSGDIHISTPDSTLPIHGTVRGGTIRFGTVGSTAITYTGSVSGKAMSGTYQVNAGSAASGGPWSASET